MSEVALLLTIRSAKWCSLLLLAVGLGMALPRGRKPIALVVFGLGFLLTWCLGFALLTLKGQSFLATWVWLSMLLSFVSLNAVAYLCGKPERGGALATLFAVGPLLVSVVLMTFKPA